MVSPKLPCANEMTDNPSPDLICPRCGLGPCQVKEEKEKTSEVIARAFHEAYERLAPQHSYETRNESRKPWDDVPDNNKELMMAVVRELLARGIIERGRY